MKYSLCCFFILVFSFCFGQQNNPFESIDRKMDSIPKKAESSTASISAYINDNFSATDDKVRAGFYWVAANISYDVENMFNQKPDQTPEEKVTNTLKSRRGVCMHYAEVFGDITKKLGVKTILIDGYTKDLKGKVAPIAHVWCALQIDGKWNLYDPTWGAGYVDGEKYFKKLNNIYYKAEPKSLRVSHMPFDYLWQFSEYPINNQEFYDGKTQSASAVKFDYIKEIANYEGSSEAEKAIASAARIEKNGLKNKLITERLNYANSLINYYALKDNQAQIDSIVAKYNESNTLLNEFIKYLNRRFTPAVSDEELKNKIQVPYSILSQCIQDVNNLKGIKKENTAVVTNLKKSMTNVKPQYESFIKLVDDYLAKDKDSRATIFLKRK